jgi:tRNA (mo5U34)-methyltransferase
MNEAEIQARVKQIMWFHNFELLPGVMTNGYKPAREEELATRFQIPQNLQGKRVLDVGCADGYYTFLAEARGASVVAIDAWQHQGFRLAHEVFGSKAEFHRLDVYNLGPEMFGTFDVVFFMGVYYHLKNPILALERIASVTREMAIIESQVTDLMLFQDEAISRFYEPEKLLLGDPTNWWTPNVPCLMQTVRAAGFPHVEFIGCYADNHRAVVHAYKGPRTATKMLTEDFVCVIHTPTPNAEVSGVVSVSGVAFSKFEPEGDIERLTVYLDKLDNPAFELGQANYGLQRSDITALVGDKYGSIGFEFNWDSAGVAPGQHTLYVLAEGRRGWHYAAKPIIVKGNSLGKFFRGGFHQKTSSRTNQIASKTTLASVNKAHLVASESPHPPTEVLDPLNSGETAMSTQSQLAQAALLGNSIGVSLSMRPGRPLANKVRHALHNLVVYYVNILANQQKRVNQAMATILKQVLDSSERLEPNVEALWDEIAILRAEVDRLEKQIKK